MSRQAQPGYVAITFQSFSISWFVDAYGNLMEAKRNPPRKLSYTSILTEYRHRVDSDRLFWKISTTLFYLLFVLLSGVHNADVHNDFKAEETGPCGRFVCF